VTVWLIAVGVAFLAGSVFGYGLRGNELARRRGGMVDLTPSRGEVYDWDDPRERAAVDQLREPFGV